MDVFMTDAVFALLCARTTVERISRNNKRVRKCIVASMHGENGSRPAVCGLAVSDGEPKTRHQDRIAIAPGVCLTYPSGGACSRMRQLSTTATNRALPVFEGDAPMRSGVVRCFDGRVLFTIKPVPEAFANLLADSLVCVRFVASKLQ